MTDCHGHGADGVAAAGAAEAAAGAPGGGPSIGRSPESLSNVRVLETDSG